MIYLFLASTIISVTFSAELLVLSGGYGHPNISVIDSDGGECTNVQFPDIPQEIGQKGRIGSFMGSFGSKMVVCGGQCDKSILHKDCKMIDVLSGIWIPISDIPQPIAFAGVSKHPTIEGLIYLLGGLTSGSNNGKVTLTDKIYTLKFNLLTGQNTWNELPVRLPYKIANLCATFINDTSLVVISDTFTGMFHVDKLKWIQMKNLSLANSGCTSFIQNNLTFVLVVGGHNLTNKTGNSVFLSAIDGEETRVVNNALLEHNWKKMPALTTNRPEGPSLIVQQNDHMIVAGGNNNTLQVDIMRQPIMDGGNWEIAFDGLATARSYQTTATIGSDLFHMDCN